MSWGIAASDQVTGLDTDMAQLALAKARFPNWNYLSGAGERMPFANQSFDRVVSGVALPYMDIRETLAEIYRILTPGGSLSISLHPLSFTLAELFHRAVPKPVPVLFRLYVAANGLLFHCTGRTIRFLRGKTESFQTERGMKVALGSAGFADVVFSRTPSPLGERFLVEAKKPKERAAVA